jgi:hemerythrin superfamily protein
VVSTDALVLLREDHKRLRALFKDFFAAADRPAERRQRIVARIIEELTAHTFVENEVLYPQVRTLLPELERHILQSFEEHHVVDVLSAEVSVLDASDERFEAKTVVLIETVTHHLAEEEQDWFPKVRAGLSRTQLRQMGEELIAARSRAPKGPPRSRGLSDGSDAVPG